jgi:hypothetical protein
MGRLAWGGLAAVALLAQGRVEVLVEPPSDAEVAVGGQRAIATSTGHYRSSPILFGNARVDVQKDGYAPWSGSASRYARIGPVSVWPGSTS